MIKLIVMNRNIPSPFSRLGAKMIDVFLFSLILGIFFKILPIEVSGSPIVSPLAILPNHPIFIYLAYALYFSGLVWRFGGTPGKIILGLRVIANDNGRGSLWSAVLRSLVEMILGPVSFINYGFLVFRKDHRALHDILAGTVVTQSVFSRGQQHRVGDSVICSSCRKEFGFSNQELCPFCKIKI